MGKPFDMVAEAERLKVNFFSRLEVSCPECGLSHAFALHPGMSHDRVVITCDNCGKRQMVVLSSALEAPFKWENVDKEVPAEDHSPAFKKVPCKFKPELECWAAARNCCTKHYKDYICLTYAPDRFKGFDCNVDEGDGLAILVPADECLDEEGKLLCRTCSIAQHCKQPYKSMEI